jgi:uncharacterized protein (DUF2267 family)
MGRRPRQFDEQFDDDYRYERFIVTIQQRAGISWEKAERAARAVLETLGERIAFGEANDLARDLPGDTRDWIRGPGGDADRFDAADFVRRVAEREGVDEETAERHIRAVFVAIARAVPHRELDQLVAELGRDYLPLLSDAQSRRRDPAPPEAVPEEDFIRRVADYAGLRHEDAPRAAAAVLEALGERIAGGEVDDLASYLPGALTEPLQRGNERTHGKAKRMSREEFIDRVAELEGVDYREVPDHIRAVFRALREAVPAKEWSDLLAELPRDYQEALA